MEHREKPNQAHKPAVGDAGDPGASPDPAAVAACEVLFGGSDPSLLLSIMDNLFDHVFIKDRHSRFILVNRTLAQRVYFVKDPSQVIGKTDFDFYSQEQARAFFEDEMKIMETGKPLLRHEERQTLLNGEQVYFITNKFPLRDKNGAVIGIWGVTRDLTVEKSAEEKLQESEERFRQAQKMEAFGQLAGGIAHDFNNMLGVIMGTAQIIELEVTSGKKDIKQHIAMLLNTGKRAAELTKQLLAFARKGSFKMVPLEGHEVIRTVIGLLRHTFDRRIRIVERLTAPGSTIRGDFAQLQNALLNLAINARDAMPDGGTLTFSTETAGPGSFAGSEGAVFESYLIIKVSDTGCGMNEKTKHRAFEPFFTTKEPGKGTGLGLSSVYGTIKSHNGLIELQSESGKGTTFTLFLPLIATAQPAYANEHGRQSKGSGTVMVVDDEEDLRFIATELLQSLGYGIITCKDGMEAVECYQRRFKEIDAVIIDLIMPRMGGYDCIIKLKQINPAACILIASGYGLPEETQKIITKGIAGFIQKPYRLEELSQTLNEVLKIKTR
jgi:two-component system, cell cycle sensor histidine kinase and response regulator CckA